MDNKTQTPQNSQPPNPSQPLTENKPHSSFLTDKLFLITVVILILFVIVYAGIYLSLNSKLNQITKPNPTPTTISQPSPIPINETVYTEATRSANWKTYVSNKFTFKYPPNYYVKRTTDSTVEEYDLILDKNVVFRVDARSSDNVNFNQLVDLLTRKTLINAAIKEISNGVKISGENGPGYGAGISRTLAVLRYKQSAIMIESFEDDSKLFDQILSTFKFLN